MSLVMSLMASFYVGVFSHEMSLMRSETELSPFLRNFPTNSLVTKSSAHSEAEIMESALEIAVQMAVAGDAFDGVFLCCPFFPRDVLDEIWGLIESVSNVFLPTQISK